MKIIEKYGKVRLQNISKNVSMTKGYFNMEEI